MHGYIITCFTYTSRVLGRPRFDVWWAIKEAQLNTGRYFLSVQARRKGDSKWYTSDSGHHRIEVFLNNLRQFKPCEKPKLILTQRSLFPKLLVCTRGLGVWSRVPKRIGGEQAQKYELSYNNQRFAIDEISRLSEQGVTTYNKI